MPAAMTLMTWLALFMVPLVLIQNSLFWGLLPGRIALLANCF